MHDNNFDLLNVSNIGSVSANNRQYSMMVGQKKFGKKGKEAVTNQFSHLHSMNMMTPLDAGMLTEEQKWQAILSFMFLKEK